MDVRSARTVSAPRGIHDENDGRRNESRSSDDPETDRSFFIRLAAVENLFVLALFVSVKGLSSGVGI